MADRVQARLVAAVVEHPQRVRVAARGRQAACFVQLRVQHQPRQLSEGRRAATGRGQQQPRQQQAWKLPAHRRSMARLAVKMARSEEHTSELQSLMRITYAVLCLKTKKSNT